MLPLLSSPPCPCFLSVFDFLAQIIVVKEDGLGEDAAAEGAAAGGDGD